MKHTIAMTGGGTGGHLAIIRAVKEEIRAAEMIYIGSRSGQDRLWFERDSDFLEKYFLDTRGVVNRGFIGKLHSLLMTLRAFFKAIYLLKKHNVALVFSVGGYSAAPASFAARIMRIPLIIHEQNAVSGSLNQIMRTYAKAFISSYENGDPIMPYPVSNRFFENARIRKKIQTVIFLGGSQGARSINSLALSMAPLLSERGIHIIHQAGEKNIAEVEKQYKNADIEAFVFGFSKDLPSLMAKSDLAIARAGASTLWELAANALPTLFIPYPYAAGDHQYYNALHLERVGAAWIMREDEIDIDKIMEIVDGNDIEHRSRAMKECSDSGGSEKIARLLERSAVE